MDREEDGDGTTAETQWIGHPDWRIDAGAPLHAPVAFRRQLELSDPRAATVRISAAPRYLLWVNGTFVGAGPARSWPDRPCRDRWEVAHLLRPGTNHLAVLVPAATELSAYAPTTRLGLHVEADLVDGEERRTVVSNWQWEARTADWISSHGLLGSLPTPAQEHARGDRDAWTTAADVSDGWQPAMEFGPTGGRPWYALVDAPVPHTEERAAAAPVVWRGRTASAEARDPRGNLAQTFVAEPCTGSAVVPTPGPLDLEAGEVATWDLGRTRPQRAGFALEWVEGTVRLEIYYADHLGDRPTARLGFRHPAEGMVDSWEPAGSGTWLALAVRGCRFVSLRLAGAGRARVRWAGRTVDYPFPAAASFACADPTIAAGWEISAASLRSCARDAFVDCCSREDMIWVGDAIISGRAAWYTFGDAALWRRTLELATAGIDDHGIGPCPVPSGGRFMVLLDQHFRVVDAIRAFVRLTGDGSIIPATADPVHRLLRLATRHLTDEDLFVPPTWSWHWVDWAPVEKRPYALPLNLLLLRAARAAVWLAEAAGHGELAAVAAALDRRLSAAVERFWDQEAGAYRSHLAPARPQPQGRFNRVERPATWGLYANGLALGLGLGDAARRTRVAATSAVWLEAQPPAAARFATGQGDGVPGCGWLRDGVDLEGVVNLGFVDQLLVPLCRAGRRDAVLAWIDRTYRPMIATGMPTWPENFSLDVHNTAHGWGAAFNSLIVEGLLGLGPEADHAGPGDPLPWNWRYQHTGSAGNWGGRQEAGQVVVGGPTDGE